MTPDAPLIETPRLILRPWREADRAPFAALNGDAETMRHFPATLSRAESDALADALNARIARNGGWGLMAMERRADGAFIGMTGLNRPRFTAHFTPCLELGWRLLREHEGHGYVTEAARACLDFAFATLGEPRVHAFTVPANTRSRAVMERLGMSRVEDGDFDHPNLPAGHPLRRHVLYIIERPQ